MSTFAIGDVVLINCVSNTYLNKSDLPIKAVIKEIVDHVRYVSMATSGQIIYFSENCIRAGDVTKVIE